LLQRLGPVDEAGRFSELLTLAASGEAVLFLGSKPTFIVQTPSR
jgi:hypothetical protein